MSVRDLPPLAQLRAFAALAETGGIARAGALLNVSHAAISQQVRALEAHLGLTLLQREGRGVQLTEEGARLGAALTDGFGTMAREVQALTGADADRPLQITTTPMFASEWLLPRLGGFRALHPEIDLTLNPTAARVTLEPGGVDVAIRFGGGRWAGLEAELLLVTEFVIAGATTLIGDCKVATPGDLLAFPWLQEIGTTETNDWLTQHGVTQGRVKSLTEMPGNLMLDALRSGQGVAATTRALIAADLARGEVRELFADDGRGLGYYVLTRPGVLRPKARAFVRWLRKEGKSG